MVLRDGIKKVWQESGLFLTLRDADRLGGKCGTCGFRTVCGGCRARAYYATGGYLDEEPYCIYDPKEKGYAGIQQS